jgi:hypothetical protein
MAAHAPKLEQRRQTEAIKQELVDQRSAILKRRDTRRAKLAKTAGAVNDSIRDLYTKVEANERLVAEDVKDEFDAAGLQRQIAELEGHDAVSGTTATPELHPMGAYMYAFEALAPSPALYARLGFARGDKSCRPLAEE